MCPLHEVEILRNECLEKNLIDSCDSLMFCVYNIIYGRDIEYEDSDQIQIYDVSMLEYYLEKDGILFIEISNNKRSLRLGTYLHFLYYSKHIIIQSVCNHIVIDTRVRLVNGQHGKKI